MSLKIEHIGASDCEPTGGLSHVDILVAPMDTLETVADIPPLCGDTPPTNVADLAKVVGNHVFKTGYGFTKITAQQDKNGLESAMIGDQKQAFENKATIVVEGSDASVLGALRYFKGKKPLLVLVRQAGNGKYRQLGHPKYPAILSEAPTKIAPEYEGENNTTFVFMDKNVVAAPIYEGDITYMPTV